MILEYNYEKELIKDFIKFISDNYKCAIVAFPDEFAATQYVNYRFVNTCDLLDEFIEGERNDIQRKA